MEPDANAVGIIAGALGVLGGPRFTDFGDGKCLKNLVLVGWQFS